MEDKSFINICSDENLQKINIDPRLVEAFKGAMYKIQKYFNEHGFSSKINFEEYLRMFLLEDSDEKLSIVVGDLPSSVGGEYNYYASNIVINTLAVIENPEELEHIICHEFIHFLVHHSVERMNGDKWGGEKFLDEAITELLAREICPSGGVYYGPLPNMLRFFNGITNSRENFEHFLDHQLQDLIRAGFYPNALRRHGDRCLEKYENGDYNDDMWQYDSEYLAMQRELIEEKVVANISSFADLKNLMELLAERPALDEEWITDFVLSNCEELINSYDNPEEARALITEYVMLKNSLLKYGGRDVCEVIVGDHVLYCDEETMYGVTDDIKYYYIIENGKSLLEFSDKKGHVVKFDYENIDIKARRKNIESRIEEIEKVLNNQKTI